jgi:hypothetical protein
VEIVTALVIAGFNLLVPIPTRERFLSICITYLAVWAALAVDNGLVQYVKAVVACDGI